MTTAATEAESTTTETAKGTPGGKGPRKYKDKPTDRERVLCESLAKKVKELTGRDVSPETVRAVRWSTSRWYEDPATKELMGNMDLQLKKAKAQAKFEAAQAALKEAQAELGDVDEDDDSEEVEESTDATSSDEEDAEDDGDDDDDDDDMFADSDSKVSASF